MRLSLCSTLMPVAHSWQTDRHFTLNTPWWPLALTVAVAVKPQNTHPVACSSCITRPSQLGWPCFGISIPCKRYGQGNNSFERSLKIKSKTVTAINLICACITYKYFYQSLFKVELKDYRFDCGYTLHNIRSIRSSVINKSINVGHFTVKLCKPYAYRFVLSCICRNWCYWALVHIFTAAREAVVSGPRSRHFCILADSVRRLCKYMPVEMHKTSKTVES